jgi:alkanesulfonate monooxygenase SsuD/methylene tetrahydromethanopterin reductase-like flavin-dependent oxidoreductase (luciferase family)
LNHVAKVGLDHVTVGDHISFHGGTGFDGLISATSILSTHDDLSVQLRVYLHGLRHPIFAARELSTIGERAPFRLVLGVGVGGEDHSEIGNSGVDPATRGRRPGRNSWELLRALLSGEEVPTKDNSSPLTKRRSFPHIGTAVDVWSGRRQFVHRLIEEYGENFVSARGVTVQGRDAEAFPAFPAGRRWFRETPSRRRVAAAATRIL